MTVRADIAAIVGKVAEGGSPERAAGLIIFYFYRLEGSSDRIYVGTLGRDLTEIVRKVVHSLTPDQVSRLVIRRMHDLGVIDIRYGWLEDDPEMVEDLAETCDIPV